MPHRNLDEILFSKYSSSGIIDSQRSEIEKAVGVLPEGKLRNESLDVLAEGLTSRFTVDVPVLDEAGITVSQPREVNVEVGGFDYGFSGTRVVKGTSIIFCIPFTGDKILFLVRPNTFSSMLPKATVRASTVEIEFSGPKLDSQQVKAEFEARLKSIKGYLEWLTNDFSGFNASLKQTAFAALNERKQRLQQNQDFVSGLGYKVQK